MTDTPPPSSNTTPGAGAESAIPPGCGTRDGQGAGDHDQPFGGWQRAHFSTQQLLRLLCLRGEILDSRLGQGRYVNDLRRR